MHPTNYTADAICRAMGLAGFIEPDWKAPVLRLLLKPSHYPEVSITVEAAPARLSVTALAEPLWTHAVPCRLAEWNEQAKIQPIAFDRCLDDFALALAADREKTDRRVVIVDGMS